MSDDSTPPGGGVRRVTYGTTDGITLVGDAWGDPSHPPVLLLHGGGQTRHAWGDTAQALAERGWYVVALDLRGHGESDWAPNGRYAFEDFASDLGGVVRNLSRPPAVVGASLGGMVALLAQGQAIEPLFSAVVLVDIAPDVEPEGIRRVVGFMLGEMRSGEFGLEHPTGWIEVLGVDPDFRGRAVGRLMADAMLAHFRAQGATEVRTLVDEEQMGDVAGFFRSLGFEPAPLKPMVLPLLPLRPL